MSNSVTNIMKILGQKTDATLLEDLNPISSNNKVLSSNSQHIKPNSRFDPTLLHDCLTRLPDPTNTPYS